METSWPSSFPVLATGRSLSSWPWDSEFALTDNTLIFCVTLRNSPEYPKNSIFPYPKLWHSPCYLCRPQTEEHWYRLGLHSNTRNPKIMPRFLHAGVFFRLCGKGSHVVNQREGERGNIKAVKLPCQRDFTLFAHSLWSIENSLVVLLSMPNHWLPPDLLLRRYHGTWEQRNACGLRRWESCFSLWPGAQGQGVLYVQHGCSSDNELWAGPSAI